MDGERTCGHNQSPGFEVPLFPFENYFRSDCTFSYELRSPNTQFFIQPRQIFFLVLVLFVMTDHIIKRRTKITELRNPDRYATALLREVISALDTYHMILEREKDNAHLATHVWQPTLMCRQG